MLPWNSAMEILCSKAVCFKDVQLDPMFGRQSEAASNHSMPLDHDTTSDTGKQSRARSQAAADAVLSLLLLLPSLPSVIAQPSSYTNHDAAACPCLTPSTHQVVQEYYATTDPLQRRASSTAAKGRKPAANPLARKTIQVAGTRCFAKAQCAQGRHAFTCVDTT
jgi:hypothetical protein